MRHGEGQQHRGLRMCGCLQQHISATSKQGTNIRTPRSTVDSAAIVWQCIICCVCAVVSVLKLTSVNLLLVCCCCCCLLQVHKGYHHGLRRFVAVKRVNFTNKVRLLLLVLFVEFWAV
jgi:hypothetical protein